MTDIDALVARALGRALPPSLAVPDLERRVKAAVAASRRKVVALDDDPTGVQTVHDVAVLADWGTEALAEELKQPEPLYFILTNSRSLGQDAAVALNREIARNLIRAGAESGHDFAMLSRSDSTLRGHFPAETDALADELGGVDGLLLCPAFFEGGRFTAGDIHFVQDGDRIVPVAETEFARDATFGYRSSALPEWVAEKSGGRIPAATVASLTLEDIRAGGPGRIAEILQGVRDGQVVIVNALGYSDLWTVVLGLLEAEAAGKRFLYRTGASFVRARAGITERPLRSQGELLGAGAHACARGVVIVGSHVRRTTEQLDRLLTLTGVVGIEVSVTDLLHDDDDRRREIARAKGRLNEALAGGQTPVIFTSRTVARSASGDELAVARIVSDALVAIVRGIDERPDFVIGKGGITSSDVGTRGLGAKRAMVLGQARPGIPVWRLGLESRFPGMPYVVFPGNVGGPETLAEIVLELIAGSGNSRDPRDCATSSSGSENNDCTRAYRTNVL